MRPPINNNAKVSFATHAKRASAVNLDGQVVVGIYMPAGFDGTKITFEAAYNGKVINAAEPLTGEFVAVVNTAGVALEYTVAVDKFIAIDPIQFLGVQWLRIVCTTDQLANRDFLVVTSTWGD